MNDLRGKRIFVSGHQGMVGSALVRRLQAAGCTRLLLRRRSELDLANQAAVDAFFEALGTDGGGIVEGSDEYNSIVFAAITDPAGTIASLDPEAEPPADTAATIDDLDVDPRSERGIELALARQERHEAAEFCRGEE
jgi:NAD(P)-dependent dehydrogenase (short-subunit alcohol dehydrogenase family)